MGKALKGGKGAKEAQVAQAKHRSTLKQVNRPFKRTAAKNAAKRKGGAKKKAVNAPTVMSSAFFKADRLHETQQKRAAKVSAVKESEKTEKNSKVPRLIALVPMHSSVRMDVVAQGFLKFVLAHNVKQKQLSEEDAAELYPIQCQLASQEKVVPIILPSWAGKKRRIIHVVFCHPVHDSIPFGSAERYERSCRIMDLCKTVDSIVTLFGDASLKNPAFGSFGAELLSLLNQQGLPSVLGCACPTTELRNASKAQKAANWDIVKRSFVTEFGTERSIFDLTTALEESSSRGEKILGAPVKSTSELVNMIRHVANMGLHELSWREAHRGYLLSQAVGVDAARGIVKIAGVPRGQMFSCKYPVHVTGLGDFPLVKVDVMAPSAHPIRVLAGAWDNDALTVDQMENTTMFESLWAPFKERSEETRVLGTGESMAETGGESVMDDSSVDVSDEEEDDDEEWQLNELESASRSAPAMQMRSKNDMEFPDEVDTPVDVPARERFTKYRPLKNFRSSRWTDEEHDKPEYFDRIFEIRPYKATLNKVREMCSQSADEVASKVAAVQEGDHFKRSAEPMIILIMKVPAEMLSLVEEKLKKDDSWIVSTLFAIERKISVQHMTCLKWADSRQCPITSKATFFCQLGFRRIPIQPIFSESKVSANLLPVETGDPSLHKLAFKRYLNDSDRLVSVASFVGPINAVPNVPAIFWFVRNNPKMEEEVQEKIERSLSSEDPTELPLRPGDK